MNAYILACLLLITSLTLYAQKQADKAQIDNFNSWTDEEKGAYILGLQLGEDLKKRGIKNIDSLLRGINKGLKEHSEISELERQKYLNAYRKILLKRKQELEKQFFQTCSTDKTFIKHPSGFFYKIKAKGTSKLSPELNDYVNCQYTMKNQWGDLIEHSKDPVSFKLSSAIVGWQEALKIMSIGDHWEIYIPSTLAFGEKGLGSKIAAYEPIILNVKLIDIIRKDIVDKKDELFFEGLKKQDNLLEFQGIVYEKKINGKGKPLKGKHLVFCTYELSSLDGNVYYRYNDKAPITLASQISALQKIIPLMRVGDQWKLYIPYQMAYGEKGLLRLIPPYSSLKCKINILDQE